MPPPADILELLTTMTRELAWLAVGWHVAIAVALTLAWRSAHASRQGRVVQLLLLALPLSVSAAAVAYGNPFNAAAFAALALALAVASRARHVRSPADRWLTWVGAALVLYGACYPHFVVGPWYRVLYAAPVGVIPCPTLAMMAGLTLLAGGVGSRAIPALLAPWTAFYALFGIFRLGVSSDAGLLVATVALLVLAAGAKPQRARAAAPAAAVGRS